MKRFLSMSLSLLLLIGCAGKKSKSADNVESSVTTVVVGEIKDLGEGWLYMRDCWGGEPNIDSVMVKDGKFRFEVTADEPSFYELHNEQGNVAYLFGEGGEVRVSGYMMHHQVRIAGTPANDAYEAFVTEAQQLSENYRAAENPEDADSIVRTYDKLVNTVTTDNASNVLGLFMLQQNAYELTAAEMLKRIEALPEAIKNHSLAQRMKELAERKMRTEPQAEGSSIVPHFIDVAQMDVTGKEVSLKSVVETAGNRYVLLDFWASWCGPCMREMPVLKEAYEKYHSQGFEIYGVSLDDNKERWQAALNHLQLKWVNVSQLKGFDCEAVKEYVVEAIPTNFLIDCKTGVIVAKNLRGEQVLETLKEKMGE